MYFVAMGLVLQPESTYYSLSLQDAIYGHAAVMRVVSAENSALGQQVHDMRRHKCTTISFIETGARFVILRLTFIGKLGIDAAHAVMNGLSRSRSLRLGKIMWSVKDAFLSGSEWTGVSTWADIVAPCPGLRFQYTFATPTAFTKSTNRGKHVMGLYPAPEDLFRGLERRWVSLGGPDLPKNLPDFVNAGGCVVAAHRLHTVVSKSTERTQVGFLGDVTYECLDDEAKYVNALKALTRFAFYSGVGYQTARGMGAVKTRIVTEL
jgi:CRISPR-associated endoribonuclease Cas6